VSNRANAEHHRQLETAIHSLKAALSAAQRNRAHTELKMLLAAHADPVQADVQAELAALEKLQPMTAEYYRKLEHIRSAVVDSRPEALEASWFPERRELAAARVAGYGSA
jgi:hypothetical protein